MIYIFKDGEPRGRLKGENPAVFTGNTHNQKFNVGIGNSLSTEAEFSITFVSWV